MTKVQRAAAIRGTTMRWTWTEGPTKGITHEHVFHDDGKVEWRDVKSAQGATSEAGKSGGAKKEAEKVVYAALPVINDVYVVSYLAGSGFTLTVVLNFDDGSLVGFASSSTEWHPLKGTFEVVE